MPSAFAQEESTCYEPSAINFHLGETPPRELWEREQTESAARVSSGMVDIESNDFAIGVEVDHKTLDDLAGFGARRALQFDIKAVRFRIVVQLHRNAAVPTERHPSIASCKLRRSSSMVSPCVAQPGIAGTSAQKPPSSASCMTTLIFMSPLLADRRKIRIHAGNAKPTW